MTGRRRALEVALYASGPLVALVTTPFLARALGPEDRGLMGVALAVASIAITVGNWGQSETFLASARAGEWDIGLARRVSLSAAVATALVALAVMLLLEIPMFAAVLSAVAIPFLVQANLWRAVAVAKGRIDLPAYANGLSAAIRLALIPGLALASWLTLVVAIGVTQFSLLLGAMLTTWWYFRQLREPIVPVSWRGVLNVTRAGSQVVGFNMLTSVTINSGVLVTQLMSTPHQVGIFSACFALSQAGLAVSGAFKTRMQSAVFEANARAVVHRELFYLAVVGLCGAGIVVVYAEQITAALLGSEYEGAALVLRILAAATLAQFFLDAAHGVLVVLGLRGRLLITGATGAVIAALGMFALVPGFGAAGAAAAVSAAFWGAALVGLTLALKNLPEGSLD